ncbi:conserved hypothetical protein [Burkholderiales bacterium 8X]|nr:conserved hypothetical protein [Burkholderiales bacterium 8X]
MPDIPTPPNSTPPSNPTPPAQTSTLASRRRLIVVILLSVAVAGAAMRQWATPGSTTRDIGTLLMVMWVPIVGNIIAWLVRRWKMRPGAFQEPRDFDPATAFEAHLWAVLTLRPSQVPAKNLPLPPDEYHAALVLGTEGFSARWRVPAGEVWPRGVERTTSIELLSPSLALPRFAPGTEFRVLVGDSFIADGRVVAPPDSVSHPLSTSLQEPISP